jgi:cytochrome P450
MLHEKYGEVVRCGPNALSFVNDVAWHDIYANTKAQMTKVQRAAIINGAHNIMTAPNDIHARQRRVMDQAFSDRAVIQFILLSR